MGIFRSLLFNKDKNPPTSNNFVTVELASTNVNDLSLTGYVQNSKDGTQTGVSIQFTETTRSVKIPVNGVGDLIHFEWADSYVRFNIINGATIISQDDLVFNAKIDSFPCTIEVTYNEPTIGVSDQQGVLSTYVKQTYRSGPLKTFGLFVSAQTVNFNPVYINTPSCKILINGKENSYTQSMEYTLTNTYLQIPSDTLVKTASQSQASLNSATVTWHTSGDAHV